MLAYIARETQSLLEQFRWDIVDNPPYSPDLEQSDLHLFLQLKQRF